MNRVMAYLSTRAEQKEFAKGFDPATEQARRRERWDAGVKWVTAVAAIIVR